MRATILDVQKMKERGERIPMVTAYDYTSAQIVDRAGIPIILVGDTLGMVVLGYPTTVPVTIDEMIHHSRAVARGSTEALIVGDLPFLTYASAEKALHNAGRFLQEGNVQAVKLEGGSVVAPIVQRVVEQGIPVMGHLGLTPQSVNQIGGMRVQGRQAAGARRLLDDAIALQDAGVFALVLELVPSELAREITQRLHVPTIGIGAGPWCSGQVQVWHDLLGLYRDFEPRHAKHYARLGDSIEVALRTFAQEVATGVFPGREHSASMKEEELERALQPTDGARG
ncbi:MAG: 3-methyl-2-oxobutanoate hydroxymethyltransferase [Chloroflexota bacterium]